MPALATAAVYSEPRSQFLDGLAPFERQAILGAATPRRIRAHSVITNQGHPADHLFMLTRGLTRYFVITEQGRKLLFQWLGPGDLFGGRTALSIHSPYLFSTEAVTDASVLVWERSTIRALIARYPRLLENALLGASDFVAWHITSHIGLACHTAPAGCLRTRYACTDDWQESTGWYCTPYHQRRVGERGERHAIHCKPPDKRVAAQPRPGEASR